MFLFIGTGTTEEMIETLTRSLTSRGISEEEAIKEATETVPHLEGKKIEIVLLDRDELLYQTPTQRALMPRGSFALVVDRRYLMDGRRTYRAVYELLAEMGMLTS